jgi:hypothetical protein
MIVRLSARIHPTIQAPTSPSRDHFSPSQQSQTIKITASDSQGDRPTLGELILATGSPTRAPPARASRPAYARYQREQALDLVVDRPALGDLHAPSC